MTAPILAGFQALRADDAPVDFAAACARITGAPLIIGAVASAGKHESVGRALLEEEATEADQVGLDGLRKRLADEGVDAEIRVLHGHSAPRALHEAAEETGAGLLVIGSTNRGSVGRMAIGSTAQRLMSGAPCPIAVVPHDWKPRGSVSTVGVAYIDAPEGHEALHAGVALAKLTGGKVRVLSAAKPHGFSETYGGGDAMSHPVTTADVGSQLRAEAAASVQAIAGEAGVPIEPDVSVGDPAEFLIGASKHLDLLVCGSRGYGPLRAVLLGGVTRRLTAEAYCPVIVLARGVAGNLTGMLGARTSATA